MNASYFAQAIMIVSLLFIQQIIFGCVTTTSRDIGKEASELSGQSVFLDKCSKCHELPVIETYPYSPVDWENIVDNMLDAKEAGQYISIEEAEKIKSYLSKHSFSGYKSLLNEE